MSPRSDRSPLFSRTVLSVGVFGLAAIAMAARSQATQPPAATPAAAAPADSQTTPPPVADSAAVPMDSTAVQTMTAPPLTYAPAPAPAKAATGAWPVDPATGQTLINGQPVVGRVFIMKKVDGIEKYEYSQVYAKEAAHPEAAIVNARHNALLPRNTRRIRGIMVQATLWSMDHKPSATELRTYRPSTSGASLGQR